MWAQGMHHNWAALFVTLALTWLPWAAVTPAVLRFGARFELKPTIYLMHFAIIVAMNALCSAWASTLVIWLNPLALSRPSRSFVQTWLGQFEGSILGSSMVYG